MADRAISHINGQALRIAIGLLVSGCFQPASEITGPAGSGVPGVGGGSGVNGGPVVDSGPVDGGSARDAGPACVPAELGSAPSNYATNTNRPVGAACGFGSQCASGGCSSNDKTGTCGVCVEVRWIGELCAGALQGCSASSYCDGGMCQTTKKGLGATCMLGWKGDDLNECDIELFCTGPDGAHEGTCKRYLARGAACPEPQRCSPRDTCEKGICVARGLRGLGELCRGHTCGAGLYCPNSGYELSTCRASTLPQDALCGVVNGSFVEGHCAQCLACGDLRYPNGGGGAETLAICVPLPLEGEPCMHSACAAGLFCRQDITGVTKPICLRPRLVGEACNTTPWWADDYAECVPSLECRGGKCLLPCQ